MQFKEQRSISFAQSDQEKVYNLQLRSSKPSFSQASTNDLHQAIKQDVTQRGSIKVAPVDSKRNLRQKFLMNKQKSFDSQGFEDGRKKTTLSSNGGESSENLQDIKYAVVISTSSCEQTMVQEEIQSSANWNNNFQKGCDSQRQGIGLRTQGSTTSLGLAKLKTGQEALKNLQSARLDKQLGRKRSETTTNNESYGFIHLKTKENRQNDIHQMKLSSNPFKLQDPHLTTEKTKKETMQSLLTMSALNHSTENSQEENDFLRARKGMNILIEDKDYKTFDDIILQPYELRQRDDINDLQRRSEDLPEEAVSEQSYLDIPNEHLVKPGSQLKKYLKPEIQKPIASIQRNRSSQDIQIDLSLINKQINEGRDILLQQRKNQEKLPRNNINTVRDSSPLKSMGQFASIKESANNQKGSMSERQNLIISNDNQNKMFTQKIQFLNTIKNQNEGNYKQPKQGQKRQNQRKQDSLAQRAATQQLNTQESPRRYFSKDSNQIQLLPYQSNPSVNQTNDRLQSDFVNSLEEEDIDPQNKSTVLVGTAHEQSSFNIGQSFHLPQSLALNKTHRLQNFIQGKQANVNNLNIRAGPHQTIQKQIAPTERESLTNNPQPQTGNLDDLKQSQSKLNMTGPNGASQPHSISQIPRGRINKFQLTLQSSMTALHSSNEYSNNLVPPKRGNSNFRNESLERILGEKANSLFDQIEKITRKEFVKVNRSILHTSNDRGRGDSQTRGLSQTPMVTSNQDKDLNQSAKVKEPQTNHLQRKRQLTFQDQNDEFNLQKNSEVSQLNLKNFKILDCIKTDNDGENMASESKGNENPRSPANFPSSVKDKIRNIQDRMKQDMNTASIAKKENKQKENERCQMRQSIISNISQNSSNLVKPMVEKNVYNQDISSQKPAISMKDHFKKYLNSQKGVAENQTARTTQNSYLGKQNGLFKVRNSQLEQSSSCHSQLFGKDPNGVQQQLKKQLQKTMDSRDMQNTSKNAKQQKSQKNKQSLIKEANIEIMSGRQESSPKGNAVKTSCPNSVLFQQRKTSSRKQQNPQVQTAGVLPFNNQTSTKDLKSLVKDNQLTSSETFDSQQQQNHQQDKITKPPSSKSKNLTKKPRFQQLVKAQQQVFNKDFETNFKNRKKNKGKKAQQDQQGEDIACLIFMPKNQPPKPIQKNEQFNQEEKLAQDNKSQSLIQQTLAIGVNDVQQPKQEINVNQSQTQLKSFDKENISEQKQSSKTSRQNSILQEQVSKINTELNAQSVMSTYSDQFIEERMRNLIKETRNRIQEVNVTSDASQNHKCNNKMSQFLSQNQKQAQDTSTSDNLVKIRKEAENDLRRSYNSGSSLHSIRKPNIKSRQNSELSSPRMHKNQKIESINLHSNSNTNNNTQVLSEQQNYQHTDQKSSKSKINLAINCSKENANTKNDRSGKLKKQSSKTSNNFIDESLLIKLNKSQGKHSNEKVWTQNQNIHTVNRNENFQTIKSQDMAQNQEQAQKFPLFIHPNQVLYNQPYFNMQASTPFYQTNPGFISPQIIYPVQQMPFYYQNLGINNINTPQSQYPMMNSIGPGQVSDHGYFQTNPFIAHPQFNQQMPSSNIQSNFTTVNPAHQGPFMMQTPQNQPPLNYMTSQTIDQNQLLIQHHQLQQQFLLQQQTQPLNFRNHQSILPPQSHSLPLQRNNPQAYSNNHDYMGFSNLNKLGQGISDNQANNDNQNFMVLNESAVGEESQLSLGAQLEKALNEFDQLDD